MEKTIMIEGEKHVGKTTTLNYVFDALIGNDTIIIEEKEQVGSNPSDFSCIIEYKGKRIAFYTMGDYSGKLKEAIDRYAHCDYFLCAFRISKFKASTIKTIKDKCKNLVTIHKELNVDVSPIIFKELDI